MKDKFILIAGPCVIDNEEVAHQIAERVKRMADQYDIRFIFKGSYKKANRTKLDSFMGLGDVKALEILRDIKEKYGVENITDIHETVDCELASEYVDFLQIPAFLCRQTELLIEAGLRAPKGINLKKGQFMSGEGMKHQRAKVEEGVSRSNKAKEVFLCERGNSFGYSNMVVDMTNITTMKKFGKVIMDCTHSVQVPNQESGITGGNAEMIETMAIAATSLGADGLFIETHPEPAKSSSDAGSILQIDKLEPIIEKCLKIRSAIS
jgi:2-dehydro-3-deoxyphosphooctonate aldolase (KDO 8-P synthase)